MRIKKYIVQKLGGIMLHDLPLDIQQDLLNRMTNQTIDNHYHSLVSFAGTTKYFTKDTKICKDCGFEGRHGHSKECKKDV